jgi:hypothetical protein
MDRQYNDQKIHGQTIQQPNETCKKRFFWSLYCLSMFLLVVVLSVHVSFGRCIACPCFIWSLYCLSMFLETWTDNTTTKRNMDRQYNDQKIHGQTIQQPNETCKKHGQAIQLPKETPVHVSFCSCIACPCFLL